jgi:ribonuclease BN (tRNA processing enzyme)
MKLKFLGTGGGRFVTGSQRRKTGGILAITDETQIHIDPGPGGLIQAQDNKPEDTEAVIVSHAHLDHSNDSEPLIEMMAYIHDHPGALFANETCLAGYSDMEKCISDYHQNLCRTVETLEEDFETEFKDLKIRSQEMFHSDPKTQGFVLETDEKSIGFWTDTEFSEELVDFYSGCDTIVIYCNRPTGETLEGHTSLDEVPDIVEAVQPSTVIITDFGYKFLNQDLDEEKEWLEDNIDAKVVFAEDGMEFPGNRSLGDF